ncbi:Uncharacterised protein [Vibrio cholerae]|nr:Uncharacterised protein [Vibrio cholerae]CSB21156.1 Uncharacterised protein [Vibrio cholerae]CSB62343.1 Uncharacterised protein [Vibrio cholerae]CSD29102.1 Uncharacterised protein [Vibrio cholerae]
MNLTGCENEGQPVPESNLVAESNNRVWQPAHWYKPGSNSSHIALEKALSVPC